MPTKTDTAILDPVEKAIGVQKGAPIDMTQAAAKANPRFAEGGQYMINCQRCVPTYELRRRGYNVVALPRPYANGTSRRGNLVGKG